MRAARPCYRRIGRRGADRLRELRVATHVYRFYNPFSGEHFYTPSADERNTIILNNPAFQYEGIGWTQPDTADRDVFRYYRHDTKLHFYTASLSEKAFVEATFGSTFVYEGSTMRAASFQNSGALQAVWRFYDPATGLYFLTASDGERDFVRTVLPT